MIGFYMKCNTGLTRINEDWSPAANFNIAYVHYLKHQIHFRVSLILKGKQELI